MELRSITFVERMIMRDYKVIYDFSIEHLQSTVRSLLNDGWALAGGISMVHTRFDENEDISDEGNPVLYYAQALTK